MLAVSPSEVDGVVRKVSIVGNSPGLPCNEVSASQSFAVFIDLEGSAGTVGVLLAIIGSVVIGERNLA